MDDDALQGGQALAGVRGQGAVVLQSGRLTEVRVELTPVAVALEPVVVVGETATTPQQREFLSRRHLPWNHSYDYADIEALRVGTLDDLLLVELPLTRMRCLRVYFDGRPTTTVSGQEISFRGIEDIPLEWVYGIEVYMQFTDIPLRYRDLMRDPTGRCGAILIWSVFSNAPRPTFYTVAVGASPGPERMVFEVSWRRAQPTRYVTAIRVRFGEYDPAELFGTGKAVELGYSTTTRILYGTAAIGLQGPMPFQRWGDIVYARIGATGTVYGGESGSTNNQGGATMHFGVGPEIAIGARMHGWKVRPWGEVRTGAEYVNGVGFYWMRPILMIGIELGGGP